MPASRMSLIRRPFSEGAVAVMFAVLAVLIFGIAAFAIDFARALVVRNELQNAADASALVGAARLFPFEPDSGKPSWSSGRDAAVAFISANRTEGVVLAAATAEVGYWNAGGWSGTAPPSLKDKDATPAALEFPAVKVTVRRTQGVNNGPVGMTFGRLLGMDSIDASATAVAVISWGGAGPGSLSPYAISSCVFDNFWDSSKNEPKKNPDTGNAWELVFSDKNDCRATGSAMPACNCGQFTSLDVRAPNTTEIRELISYGNKEAVDLTNGVWISSGTMAGLFAGGGPNASFDDLEGKSLNFPVIDLNAPPCDGTIGTNPLRCKVVAIACVRLDKAVQNGTQCRLGVPSLDPLANPMTDNKANCLIGHLATDCKATSGGGTGGPFLGSVDPPRLVR